ncbi:MAG: hypothetical protein HN380_10285 [Victivallales bacterium]|nr:hypothetical protein [Victivallales bacterium]
MQWLELVRVCGSWDAETEERLQDNLPPELEKLRADPRCCIAAAFQHAEFPGDFAVLVVWRGSARPCRSIEVGSLASYLSAFGMVDHLLWVGFAGWFGVLDERAAAALTLQADELPSGPRGGATPRPHRDPRQQEKANG